MRRRGPSFCSRGRGSGREVEGTKLLLYSSPRRRWRRSSPVFLFTALSFSFSFSLSLYMLPFCSDLFAVLSGVSRRRQQRLGGFRSALSAVRSSGATDR
ncbi:hypothetical protein BRADI_2g23175v3 [Brachypodium distachyon]|uniref:Transmembrane protein n=1 Tax=Brachypodium distachyon TaxID=15368 RepID=A0A0Q3MP32_BRADI|nr:hypothetical protein BRADI_2g23175v3 [Brachypodium distachyon]